MTSVSCHPLKLIGKCKMCVSGQFYSRIRPMKSVSWHFHSKLDHGKSCFMTASLKQ